MKGIRGGAGVSGPVRAICRRSGVTGRSTPAIAPTAADQGPAAQTTARVRTFPDVVRTARTCPPSTSIPVTVVCVRTVTPSRWAARR
ncbi:hypothetical protein QFZ67_006805 [Streptomyces sp. V1I1]|nr:hypothetical protein [Streptomyces sp. V1I1]